MFERKLNTKSRFAWKEETFHCQRQTSQTEPTTIEISADDDIAIRIFIKLHRLLTSINIRAVHMLRDADLFYFVFPHKNLKRKEKRKSLFP